MTEIEKVTEIVSQKKHRSKPNKPIYILNIDKKEECNLPIIGNNDYIGFANAIVENIALVYEMIPQREHGCFAYTYQNNSGFTMPCDRCYHIPHNKEDTLCRKIYKNIITNSAYNGDEDIAYDILRFWKELKNLPHEYIILHTPILFKRREDQPKVVEMMKTIASPFPIETSQPVRIHFEGKV